MSLDSEFNHFKKHERRNITRNVALKAKQLPHPELPDHRGVSGHSAQQSISQLDPSSTHTHTSLSHVMIFSLMYSLSNVCNVVTLGFKLKRLNRDVSALDVAGQIVFQCKQQTLPTS